MTVLDWIFFWIFLLLIWVLALIISTIDFSQPMDWVKFQRSRRVYWLSIALLLTTNVISYLREPKPEYLVRSLLVFLFALALDIALASPLGERLGIVRFQEGVVIFNGTLVKRLLLAILILHFLFTYLFG